ncbi:MAG TPA: ROK family protein [Ktedonobacterales bacterium]
MDARHVAQSTDSAGQVGVELADLATRLAVALPGEMCGQMGRVRRSRFERPPEPEAVIERIGALVESLGAPVAAGVGVAFWGRVEPVRGEVADARAGAAWAGFPFGARLAARLGAPVRLMTGVSAAARAEALAGAAAGRSPLLYVHLGRRVTSALALDGVPLLGAHYDAGRLGHWQTGLDGPRCACGAQGHLDPLVSAQSLVRLAIGVAADDEDTLAAIHRVTGMRAEALTAAQLIGLARDGVRPLRDLVEYALDALAGALANLVMTLDPAVIVIGGPLALADEVFFVWLRERLAAHLAGAPPEIAAAACEPFGALRGAIWPEPASGAN